MSPPRRFGRTSPARSCAEGSPARRFRPRGFTLIELLVALTLLALMSTVLFGALGFAGRSWEGGEAKAEQVAGMRLAEGFLRSQLESAHPLRMRKMAQFPLLFGGTESEIRYAAPLPSRVSGGGIWFYRLAVQQDGEKSRLVLERLVPDLEAGALPEFAEADRSILAEDIKSLRIGYYGRDVGAAQATAPTWRDRWDDPNRMPLMIRIEVLPARSAPWPVLLVAPRQAHESGCRQWDAGAERCVGMS